MCIFTEDAIEDALPAEKIRTLLKGKRDVNDDKTGKTMQGRMKDNKKENWRIVKKQESLLGDLEDVIRRKQLAAATMTRIDKM